MRRRRACAPIEFPAASCTARLIHWTLARIQDASAQRPLVVACGSDAHVSSPNPASNYGDAINPNTGQHELEVGGDSYDPAGDSSNNVLTPCAQPATTL